MLEKISVIIPSFNSGKTIERTLASLGDQEGGEVSEVIVVDSSTDPETQALLDRRRSQKVRVVRAGVRVMPAASRNLGAQMAAGDLLVFVDADACLEPGWLAAILERHAQGCRLGGGSVILPERQRWRWIPLAQYFLQFNEYMDVGSARTVRFLPSCNMFCERGLFESSGGFPEIRAAEDVLFFLRAGRQAPVWFVPEARARHIFREDLAGFLRNQRMLGKYILVYRRQVYADKFYYRGFWPALFLPGFVLLKWWGITARVLRSRPGLVLRYVLAQPLFLAGLLSWCAGFLEAVRSGGEAPRAQPAAA